MMFQFEIYENKTRPENQVRSTKVQRSAKSGQEHVSSQACFIKHLLVQIQFLRALLLYVRTISRLGVPFVTKSRS